MHTCGTYWLYSPLASPSPISPRHSAQLCISSIFHVFMTHHVKFVLPSHTLGWSTVEHVEPTRRHIHKANGAFFLPSICLSVSMSSWAHWFCHVQNILSFSSPPPPLPLTVSPLHLLQSLSLGVGDTDGLLVTEYSTDILSLYFV